MTNRPDIESMTVELPSEETPLADGVNQACGSSYAADVRVNQPVRGFSAWSPVLPRRAGEDEIGTTSFARGVNASLDNVRSTIDGRNPHLPVRLRQSESGDRSPGETRGLVHSVVDPRNRQAILHVAARGQQYLEIADQLARYWAATWRPAWFNYTQLRDGVRMTKAEIEAQIPGWPLDIPRYDTIEPRCVGIAAAQTTVVELLRDGAPYATIELTCPSTSQRKLHSADIRAKDRLLLAAMMWARCAEEATYVVATHHLNERDRLRQENSNGDKTTAEDVPGVPDPGPIERTSTHVPAHAQGYVAPGADTISSTSDTTATRRRASAGIKQWWDGLTPIGQAIVVGAGVTLTGLAVSRIARPR